MRLALEEARQAMLENEVPVGAVLVKDNRILVKTHNKKEVLQDATAHAEILAIREGGRILQNWRLDDCALYVTLEPCFMCASAILQSRIKTLVYGARDAKQGAIESRGTLLESNVYGNSLQVYAGYGEEEAAELLQTFFSINRNKETGLHCL